MVAALTPGYPVYCLKPHVLKRIARRFLDTFPGRVLYAVKCNPHPEVLRALFEAGIRHFDTASLPEIGQVRELFPNVEPYFMHPVKGRAVIRTAYEVYRVRHFVVDHKEELDKVLGMTGGEGVIIFVRVATPKADVLFDLSEKFGAPPELAVELLRAVRREGCAAGAEFHVGSQCVAPEAYREALRTLGQVLSQAGTEIQFLDVGGGFPAAYPGANIPPLEEYVRVIEEGVSALGLRRDCVLMCEPGRALVADGCSLVVQVLLRKGESIYINDGIHGSLSEMATARLALPTRLVRLDGKPSRRLKRFTVNGPTCDSIDVLPVPFTLPEDVREGDWIEIDQIGAYGSAMRTQFNGFYPDTFVEIGKAEGTAEPEHAA